MRNPCWLALCCGLLWAGGCSKAPAPEVYALDPAQFSGEKAYQELEDLLALGLRDSGTPGAETAARHLQQRLKDHGVEARISEFEEMTPRGLVTFRNVIGRIPGKGPGFIVVGSHYDTKSGMPEGFQGANDSGSSTAVLLEMAALAARQPGTPPVDLLFVFFDGEECRVRYTHGDGLHGSLHFVRELQREKRVKEARAMILLDMVGDRDLGFTLPRNSSPELLARLFDAAREENVRHLFSLYPHAIGDDHEPFLRAGIPAINLIDFHFGSAPGRNDHWHSAEDTLDKIAPESLQISGRVTLRLLNRLFHDEQAGTDQKP